MRGIETLLSLDTITTLHIYGSVGTLKVMITF